LRLIYLASPYSHEEDDVRAFRYAECCRAVALILQSGRFNVFSPIVHSHPLALHHGMGGTYENWKEVDEDWINRCDELWILMLPGWKESVGVNAEAKYALDHGKAIRQFLPENLQEKLDEGNP